MTQEFYRIYNNELRGLIEGEQRKSFLTFNEGNYQNESRKPIGILNQLTEHYLGGSRQLEFAHLSDSFILIPIEGELHVNSNGISYHLAPQEIFLFSSETPIRIENSFPSGISRFYCIQIGLPHIEPVIHAFDLSSRNHLVPVIESAEISLKMGIFDGRKEGRLSLPDKKNSFITSINGAFEVQNRLLETNDSLFIGNNPEMEFESLSENAVILTFSF